MARHPHQHMEDAEDADIEDEAVEEEVKDIVHATKRRTEHSLRHQEVRPHTKAKSTSPTP